MEAQQIDNEKFGSEFPDSTRIEAGNILEVTAINSFESKDGYKGVSLTTEKGSNETQNVPNGLFHTTTAQPLGYILSDKVGLQGLIDKAEDGRVTLYFYSEKPNSGTRDSMLKCSVFKPSGGN